MIRARLLVWASAAMVFVSTAFGQSFTEEAQTRGISLFTYGSAYWGFGVGLDDLDGDGDVDLIATGGLLGQVVVYENDGTGYFIDRTAGSGLPALPQLSGISLADYDGDGDLDVYITAISHPVANDYLRTWSDPTLLLINGGAAAGYAFENEFLERGLPFNEGDIDGSMVDFDNDGRMDLAVSRDRKYEVNYDEIDQKAWFGLMHQQEDGAFASLGPVSGINDPDADYLQMKSAQNHAWSDYDHDGDLDLLIGGRDTGGGRPNFLFRNDVGHQNLWLAVRVVGDGEAVTRDAFGTRVTLRYPDRVVMRELKASRGTYNSMDSRALHFGLGAFGCDFTELEVRWPDGQVDTYAAGEVPVNHYITVRRDGALTVDE